MATSSENRGELFSPFRFFLYAGDRSEPPHAHIEPDDKQAKFWLDPVRLQNSHGFGRSEINRMQRIIEDNQKHLLRR